MKVTSAGEQKETAKRKSTKTFDEKFVILVLGNICK